MELLSGDQFFSKIASLSKTKHLFVPLGINGMFKQAAIDSPQFGDQYKLTIRNRQNEALKT
ncbi:hypothetical protein T11_17905 [Trichinella zimbabwensis]|uniref:Uncharacterized protein n=1 Tax=Trichinella zimbabwensis TaxID=268475 RepID=A0A0V1H5B3_9BILA|nr:hypothetical protein T11_12019 [Trichinella zimbabwensis]KRZ05364.1 hypothetical protein T11_17905 [Trichinella zimbabwensis]